MSIQRFLKEKGSGAYESYPIQIFPNVSGKIISAGIINCEDRQVVSIIAAGPNNRAYSIMKSSKTKDPNWDLIKDQSVVTN